MGFGEPQTMHSAKSVECPESTDKRQTKTVTLTESLNRQNLRGTAV